MADSKIENGMELPPSTLICLQFMGAEKLAELEQIVGHKFKNPALLVQAMTHKSCQFDIGGKVIIQSNEKLEHLGDKVVGLIVCKFLHLKYPDKSEHFYSQVLEPSVSNKVLSQIGESIGLNRFLISRVKTLSATVMADAMEAVLGALFLDAGSDVVDNFLSTCLYARVEEIANEKATLR